MSKLAILAALVVGCIMLAFAIDAAVLSIEADHIGKPGRPSIDPSEAMKRVPSNLPAERFDAY